MGKPVIYGISSSRALRSLWAIEEVGIEYDHEPVHFAKGAKEPAYLSVNPNARIPALVDGELKLAESMAINLYLAKQYGGALYPRDTQREATAWQWSVWAISEIEPYQMQIVVQQFFVPEDKRDAAVIEAAGKSLQRPLAVLNNALKDSAYLLGDEFSIADLNVASVMLLLQMVGFDYSEHTHVARWADHCYARDSLARARALP